MFLLGFRPLTQEEIAQRKEIARQRHAERMMADQTEAEGHKYLCPSASRPQESQPSGLSTGDLNAAKTHNRDEEYY